MRNPIVRRCLILLAGLIHLAAFAPAAAAETDLANIPMAVSNNAPANFMFMVDNSGSMSNIVPESPYAATGASYLGGACTASSQAVQTSNEVYLRVVNGVPKAQLANRVGSGGSSTDCTSGCDVGTASGQVCFVDEAVYTNVRLLATESCGTNCRTALGASYLPAEYSGRYLNWYFRTGTLTGWGERKPQTRTRLEVAKKATKTALDTIPLQTTTTAVKARVGLTTYNGGDGGLLVRGLANLDASHLTNLKSSIDGLAATGSTPLSETLADIGHYFTLGYTGNLTIHPGATTPTTVSIAQLFKQGTSAPHRLSGTLPTGCTGLSCPVQYWCQRSIAVLMTDGRPQQDQALSNNESLCDYDGDSGGCTTSGARAYDQKNGGTATNHTGHLGGAHSYESAGSDYLDDVAQALFETDLRPDLSAPGGQASLNNLRTYTVGFADRQAQDDPLMQETARQGGGLFLSAENEESLTRAFVGALNDALDKDSAAAAVAVTSTQLTANSISYASSFTSGYWTGDLEAFSVDLASGLPITPRLWSAQARLDALASPQSSRRIVSWTGSSGSAFTGANFRDDAIGLTTGVIDYLRGDRSGEGSIYRRRQHLLGDIINAEPVIVSYGSSTVVYQGANDGMLHAFDGGAGAVGGSELWAYVPKMLHSRLWKLAEPTYAHEYFIDATPAVADVDVSGFRRKILVGGLGKGGSGYYALDITDGTAASETAAAAKALWEKVPAADSGFSFGTPLIVRTPNDGWVVLVTSGYNNGTSDGGDGLGHVWALDPRDGTVLRHITTPAGSPSTPAGLTHLARLSNAAPDEVTRFAYGGDLLGNVWRFDLANWSATKIAALADGSGAAQPVSSAPVVRQVRGTGDKFYVYVGTGLYLGNSDVPGNTPVNAHATQTQSMYGIIDDTTLATPTLPDIRGSNGTSCPGNGGNGDFVCQRVASSSTSTFTLTTNTLQVANKGWYFDLPIANGRINTHPAVTTTGVLVFTVNVPTTAICDPGGSSWFFAVDADTGGAVRRSTTGTSTFESGWYLGNALGSRPVIVDTSSGKRALIRMSDRTVKNPTIPEMGGSPPTKWRRVYWRELM
ncbi:pilus assembly protein [Aromatoleum petrolei]|uniref:PilY1 beta-propeller domain-containing protein n=1 Tax=Aromatoleum petrolei TaxID=76116 RepID=A0ABX1MSD6_9RHOO|nr:PilC/PilY family type IV pilus protein [Aromatoleum petrolei]NMF90693.1 hypothetical protein [Aromatoleum petrolei]QTQ36446.1 PilC beta-propeller domain-containing protein [Aromatoleum petrolei]